MIVIECDGPSHHAMKVKASDKKRDAKLNSLGWTVLRFSNKAILNWLDTGMPQEHFISTILQSYAIRPLALTDA